MNIRRFFSWVMLFALITGTVFTPGMAATKSLELHARSCTLDKIQPVSPQAPTDTHTVCATGCDYNSIQDAIDNAIDGDIIDLATETYTETITINKSINLIGEGAENTILQAAGEPGVANNRVIKITSDVTTTIEGVTIQYGNIISGEFPENGGGGIFNSGILTLTNSIVKMNSAAGSGGGGIYNFSTGQLAIARINNSTFSDNSAYSGGGANNYGYSEDISAMAKMQITNSTFINNSANSGGGVSNTAYAATGILTITNSTISGNQATQDGGGVFNLGGMGSVLLTINHSTLSENSANRGGGIYAVNASPDLYASILSKNLSGNDCETLFSSINDLGYNLVEDGSCGFPVGGDPMLGPLQDNDGPTWTHALLLGSPAIDAIPIVECRVFTDQRGVSRPQGTNCDIGAFELGVLHLDKYVNNPTPIPGEVITFTIQVSNGLTETITVGVISDTLPAGLNFIGPITLEPPISGTVESAPPTLATDLMIGTGEQITVTFPISVSYGIAGDTVITNTAWVTSAEVITPVLGNASITIANVAPVGVDDPSSGSATAFTTDEETAFTTGNVLTNDHDNNGDTLSVSALDTSSTLGLVSNNGDGTFDYDPNSQFDNLAPGEQATDTFSYTVSDGTLTDTATVTITILGVNNPPIVYGGSNQTVDEGDLVQFGGSYTDPDSGASSAAIHWEFGDGNTAIGTLTPTHTFLDNDVYTVTLTITDTFGGVGSDWLLVTVENVAPSLSELPDQETPVGETITVTGTITDPGALDTQTVVITWTEGVTETLQLGASEHQFSLTHTYSEPGEYLVSVRVTDKDGGWDQKTINIIVTLYKIYLPLVQR